MGDEGAIVIVGLEKGVMGPLCHESVLVQKEDPIRVPDGGQSVCYDEECLVSYEGGK